MQHSNLCFVSGSHLQAASMHKFLQVGINLMLDLDSLQQGMISGGPLLDNSIRVVTIVVALNSPNSFSTSASDSELVPSSSAALPPGQASSLRIAFVGIVKQEGGQHRPPQILDEALGNRVTQKIKT
jgi:hypothetical protein